jgi:hypothetical protein
VPPSVDDVIATVCVPLHSYLRSPSPTLSSLLDACDPRPEESAAVASLRLLAASVAKNTGMVNGKKGSAAASSGGAGGKGSGKSAGAPAVDQIRDDETFLAVMRQVAAVLKLNKSAAADASAPEDGPGGEAGAGAGTGAGAGAAPGKPGPSDLAKLAAAASSNGGSDVNDVDALAALINAMEAGAANEDALLQGDVGVLGGPRGGSAADADAAAHKVGGKRARKTVRWVSHLARHPYFAGVYYDSAQIMDEYASYAHPLTQLASRLAASATASASTGVAGKRVGFAGVGGGDGM